MSTNRATHVLVALDLNDEGDVRAVLDFLGDALVSHETGTQTFGGAARAVHRFSFDRTVRNTHAHGVGYRAGFMVHCESV